MTVGEKIKDMRMKYGYRQAELADRLGCSKQVISNIERGVTGVSADLALRVAKEFHVPVDDVLSSNGIGSVFLSRQESALVSEYRKLLPEEREMLMEMLEVVVSHRRKPAGTGRR